MRPSTGFRRGRLRVRSCLPRALVPAVSRPLQNVSPTPPGLATTARRAARSLRASSCLLRVPPTVTGRSHHITPIIRPKNALPSRVTCLESTPGRHVVATFGNGLPPPLRVPSSWFHATSTVCSSKPLRGYCTALPTIGFDGLHLLAELLPSHRLPFEAFPPQPAARRHHPACATCSPTGPAFSTFTRPPDIQPLAVADDQSDAGDHPGPQGLDPPAGPLTTAALPPCPSRCSHGLA